MNVLDGGTCLIQSGKQKRSLQKHGVKRNLLKKSFYVWSFRTENFECPFTEFSFTVAEPELGLFYVDYLSKYLFRSGLAVADKRFCRFLYFTNQWYRMVSIQ